VVAVAEPLDRQAAPHAMNIKRHLAIAALVVVPFVGLFTWLLSAILWLPDLISPDASRVIGRCTLTNGETVELTQRWVGDGYLTGVRHHRVDGSSVFAVGDGDAARAFRCNVSVSTDDSSVTFRFSGRQWRYHWSLHSLSCGDGHSREAT